MCEYTPDGTEYGCAFYDIFHIALWKTGKALSDPPAVATLVTALGTLGVAVVTYRQLNHNRQVERAYVKMSPNGAISFGPAPGQISISLEIKNHGSTPARVTDLVFTADTFPNGQALPAIPPYRRSAAVVTRAFLVSGNFFYHVANLQFPNPAHVTAASKGVRQLLIFGYVDYIDQFEQRHRGGFARRYNQLTNIEFVTEPAYNYDRVRLRGEGNDWLLLQNSKTVAISHRGPRDVGRWSMVGWSILEDPMVVAVRLPIVTNCYCRIRDYENFRARLGIERTVLDVLRQFGFLPPAPKKPRPLRLVKRHEGGQ
jgi:hypothetical protein